MTWRGTPEYRFNKKIEPEPNTGCFLWMGYTNIGGYGKFKLKGKTESAHRVAWMLSIGEIEEGMHVLHSCDNRCCVNIEHLFLGTNADNCFDRSKKDRGNKSRVGLPYGVSFKKNLRINPYQSHAWDGERVVTLGHFKTAEEASDVASAFKNEVIRSRVAYH